MTVRDSCAKALCKVAVTISIGHKKHRLKKYRLTGQVAGPTPVGGSTVTKTIIPKKVRTAMKAAKKKHKTVRVVATIT